MRLLNRKDQYRFHGQAQDRAWPLQCVLLIMPPSCSLPTLGLNFGLDFTGGIRKWRCTLSMTAPDIS